MIESNICDLLSLKEAFENILNADCFSGRWDQVFSGQVTEWLVTAGTSFSLIAAAEMGDKSQVVCMTLAARYQRPGPVLMGAMMSFALLNLLAVVFGGMVAKWVPENLLMIMVVVLFAVFGVQALRIKHEGEKGNIAVKGIGNMFVTTFVLITAAEFGDKTQLAVAGLSSTMIPASVWIGATSALVMTSAIGIWAGKSILRKIPIVQLHRISGIFFLGLALAACYRIWQS